MATNRDAQTFLIGLRSKYPQYKDYDDATLMSAIQKKYPQYRDINVGTLPHSESLIDKALKASRGFMEGFSDVETLGASTLARKAAESLVPLPPQAEQKYQEMTSTDPTAKAIGGAIPVARGIQQLGKLGINSLF